MPASATISPARRLRHLDAIEPVEGVQLGDARLLGLLVRVERQQRDDVADVRRAALDAPDAQPAEVRRVVDRRNEHLERTRRIARRRRHLGDDRLEQRREILQRLVHVHRRRAIARRDVDDRRVELRLVGLELDEEVEDLVVHAQRIGAGPIDLVDDDDRRAAERERLAQHEARLRHRPVERVDDEQHAVDHAQDALDLAAEVGVAGRVDDVDLGAVPTDGGVLGEDRDPPLTLERVRVHHALLNDLIIAKRAGLAEHLVDEGRLAVIDVRDDSDVTDLHSLESIRLAVRTSGHTRMHGRVLASRLCVQQSADTYRQLLAAGRLTRQTSRCA